MTDYDKFFKESMALIGQTCNTVNLSDTGHNFGGMQREIKGILYPQNKRQVIYLVNLANEHKVPLYPFSTGKNYGLGSKLPVMNGAVLVSLEYMKDLSLDLNAGSVTLEPGVTQQQVYEKLSGTKYFLDVTGSGKDTSIIGNLIDGGDTYYSAREIRSLEVVLGTGHVVNTGSPNSARHHISGPDIGGLFRQSNFGIVTKATISLLQAGEDHAIMNCRLHDENLFPEFVDRIFKLRREGVITSSVHIANKNRKRRRRLPSFNQTAFFRRVF